MQAPRLHRFGRFEFDETSLELTRDGSRVPLEPQPARLLALLLEREGTVVPTEEIRRRLWPDGSFVEVDRGIRYAIGHLRRALGEPSRHPLFIHTVSRRGYRFSAPEMDGMVKHEPPATSLREPTTANRQGPALLAAGALLGLVPGATYAHVVRPVLDGDGWLDWGCLANALEAYRALF